MPIGGLGLLQNLQHVVDDDLDAGDICIMVSATTLLNLYDELSQCCNERKLRVWVNLRRAYLCTRCQF